MNIPESELINWLYWLVDTPTIGGVIVGVIATITVLFYTASIFWVQQDQQDQQVNKLEKYPYPTPALHHEEEDEEEERKPFEAWRLPWRERP